MTHPATAPILPWPAIWPARPPTTAPLMHPFASAVAGAKAMPRRAVQRVSDFMADLLKKQSLQQSVLADLVPESTCAPAQRRGPPPWLRVGTDNCGRICNTAQ